MDNQELPNRPTSDEEALPAPRPSTLAGWQKLTSQAASKSIPPIEIALMTLLGIVGLCGLGGILLSFLPAAEPSQSNVAMAPTCLGLAVGGFSSLGLIWFRQRALPASAWLAVSIILWFIGLIFLGLGGFSILNPGEEMTFSENLGFSLALCFAPGAFLAVAGLGLYIYDRRRRPQVVAQGYAAAETQPNEAKLAQPRQSQAEKLERAAEYRAHILDLINQKRAAFSGHLAPIKAELQEWEAYVRRLAERLHAFEANPIIQRDLGEIPAAIERLQTQLEHETDPNVRADIAQALAGYRKHYSQLESLSQLMRRTEYDIDETLAAIAGIYSQLQLLSAKNIDSSRAQSISNAIEEQADRLNDLLAAMDEVYQTSIDDQA